MKEDIGLDEIISGHMESTVRICNLDIFRSEGLHQWQFQKLEIANMKNRIYCTYG